MEPLGKLEVLLLCGCALIVWGAVTVGFKDMLRYSIRIVARMLGDV